jgi:hypothetical protein
MTDVLLVARSIGRRSLSEPLCDEGHAGLILDLGEPWIVQAGPANGLLQGTLAPCGGRPWRDAFAEARGAIWDSGGTEILAVSILQALAVPEVEQRQLAAITGELNARRLDYRYESGPNSNTFVRLVLEALGSALPVAPAGDLTLRGWSWGVPSAAVVRR